MKSVLSINVLVVCAVLLSSVFPVEAQRVRTLQSIVYGSTYETAMNSCKNGAGGNVIISKDSNRESYYCHFDINVAKAQAEYNINKKRQEEQKRRQQSTSRR